MPKFIDFMSALGYTDQETLWPDRKASAVVPLNFQTLKVTRKYPRVALQVWLAFDLSRAALCLHGQCAELSRA